MAEILLLKRILIGADILAELVEKAEDGFIDITNLDLSAEIDRRVENG